MVESLPASVSPITASSWSQLRRKMQPTFGWVEIFQIARPSCRGKIGPHLSSLLRGVHTLEGAISVGIRCLVCVFSDMFGVASRGVTVPRGQGIDVGNIS